MDTALDLLDLAHQCGLTNLETIIGEKLKLFLNDKNIIAILNLANLYDLIELRDTCHAFIDPKASEILKHDAFNELSQVKTE